MQLNVNANEVIALTAKLEQLNRSAFPSAVKNTLNTAAFDMKKNELPASASSNFINRKPSFFKANSKVITANGFDVNTMKATVGFTGKDQAVDDLEQQESGGTIKSRSFIPLKFARSGNSNNKLVRANARLKNIKIIDAKNAPGKNDKEKFVQSVIHAGVGGIVLSEINGRAFMWKVNSLKRTSNGSFKLTPLYSFKKGRTVTVKARHFVEEAATKTAPKIEDYYKAAAEYQFKKVLK